MPPVATLPAAPESQSQSQSDLMDIMDDDELGGWMEEEDQLASDPLDVGGQHEGLQSNVGRDNNSRAHKRGHTSARPSRVRDGRTRLVQGPSHHLAEPTSSSAVPNLPLLSGPSLDLSPVLSRDHSSTLAHTKACLTLEQTSACHAKLVPIMQSPNDEQHSTPSHSNSPQTHITRHQLSYGIDSQRNASLLTMEAQIFPGGSPSRDSHDSDSETEEDELLPSSRPHPSTAIAPRPSSVRAVMTPVSFPPSMSSSPVNHEERVDVCIPSSPRAVTPRSEQIARSSIPTSSRDAHPAIAPAVLIASLPSPCFSTPGAKRSCVEPITERPTPKRARTGSYASHCASSEDKPILSLPLAQRGSGASYILDASLFSAIPVHDWHSIPAANSTHDNDNNYSPPPDAHSDADTIVPETPQPRSLLISSSSSSFVSSAASSTHPNPLSPPSPTRITTDHLLSRADPAYPFSPLERRDTFVLPHHNTYERGSNTFASSSIAEDSEASRLSLDERGAGLPSNAHRLGSRPVQDSRSSCRPGIIVHSDSGAGHPHSSTSLVVPAAPSLLGPATTARTRSLNSMGSLASMASIEQRVHNVDVVDEKDAGAGRTRMLKLDLKGMNRRWRRRKKRISGGGSDGSETKLVVKEGAKDMERVRCEVAAASQAEDSASSSVGFVGYSRTIDKKDWGEMTAVAHLDRRFVVARLRPDGQRLNAKESSSKRRGARDSRRKKDSLWIVEQHNATFRFEYERMMRNEQKALQRQSQAETSSSGNGHTANVAPEVPEHEKEKIFVRAKRVSIKQGQPLPESIMNHLVWNLGKTDEPLVCPDGRPTVAHLTDLNDIFIRRKERRMNRKVDWGKLDAMGRKSD
ncbi:uncharacterized protein STEHIDRAFT_158435 [Stereum hirsutum FP-91666 SS1]|uniref:uncharacterized protein n=1 Tax=Stereum hirsutum (strain FP-91666) TaxID=721885 RepID=UPI0004449B95|nr:uncharacterized protein STEHIDRAFT_158435 [Stereum hirsutum FP-91666 SS1]EIM84719.1 hypothetical protein STEHIDRAFT_158435 [Stereum hirsutum FP-91666 SS1]